MRKLVLTLGSIFVAMASGLPPASAAQPFVQPQKQFTAALDNHSTSPSFVLITVIDGRTDYIRTGCVTGPALLGALQKEHGGQVDARALALAQPDHVYMFKNPDALANIDLSRGAPACKIIQAGHMAVMRDHGGDIVQAD